MVFVTALLERTDWRREAIVNIGPIHDSQHYYTIYSGEEPNRLSDSLLMSIIGSVMRCCTCTKHLQSDMDSSDPAAPMLGASPAMMRQS